MTERRKAAMIEIIRKVLTPTGVKINPGRVEAAFSVFNSVDLEGDIVVPGAIPDGTSILLSQWNHGSWQPGVLPLGRGRIRTTDHEAVIDAEVFDTPIGRDTLEVLRGLGDLCKWSFAYQILDHDFATIDGKRVQLLQRLQVHEASPCLVGANDRTRTLTVGDADADPAREYARYVEAELTRQLAAELAEIRAGMEGAA